MTFQELYKSIKKKDYKPVYVLHGEEDFFIDELTDLFENSVLQEGEKAFNFTILYGKEANAIQVVDVAKRYPMMAPYQLLIIKEAQDMKSLASLKTYIENPSPTTIFVICHKHKKLDKRTAFGKAVTKKSVVFESKKLYENQVPEWLIGSMREKGHNLRHDAAQLMTEYLGNNLSKINNSVIKMCLNLKEGQEISIKDVQENIGINKDYNVFELQDALGARNIEKSNRIINYFASNPKKNPLVVVLGSLFGYFSKIYAFHFVRNSGDAAIQEALGTRFPFIIQKFRRAAGVYPVSKVENILLLLSDYDLRSKGVNNGNASPDALMKELIYKILH